MNKTSITIWKPIPGFENYCISSSGDVLNLKRDQIKKPMPDKKGYLKICLVNGSKGRTTRIHRLVAAAFIPNFSQDLQVNHINCIKSDNRIENLEMVTQSQNTKHAWSNKRMKLTMKGADGKFIKR
jgi:hypothetical protein